MTTYKYEANSSETDTEAIRLLLLSILDEHGPITLNSERFRAMGDHGSWSIEMLSDDDRMSVSVKWH